MIEAFNGIPQSFGQQRQNIELAFHDIAGEAFRSGRSIREHAPFVTSAQDLVFLFDPTTPNFSALSAAKLVDDVHNAAGVGERKNLIIALTKVDVMRDRDEWWAELAETWPDTPPWPSDLLAYLRQMDNLSDKLYGWWMAPEQQAHGFINRLPPTTHYCALSSLGHQPVWDCPHCKATEQPNTLQQCGECNRNQANANLRLTRKPEPFRVRDPLFWIFRAAGVM